MHRVILYVLICIPFSRLLYFLSLIPLLMTDAAALGALSFERVYQNRNPWWFSLLHPQRESLSRATDSSLAICQQIWKTQQWPQDWKRAVCIPIPKKGNAKEC